MQTFAKLPSRLLGLAGRHRTFDYVVRGEALCMVHSIIADRILLLSHWIVGGGLTALVTAHRLSLGGANSVAVDS